jgi:hypothetical protein
MDDDAALQGMYGGDNVYEAEEKEESLDDILARIIGTKADPYMAEDLYEAEEEDIEIDTEEEVEDEGGEEEKPANDSIVVDKRIVSLSSLPSNTRKILDSLETLRGQAEEFGDQKFITQVGNTITFFTRDFVVAGDEPTKAKVDESLEMLRMQKLAGVITESQYETKKKVLKEKTIVNELSPELLSRAADKAKSQGRGLQANKFSDAALRQTYKAAAIEKSAKMEPMEPFKGKELNLYYDIKTDKGITPAVTVPHKINDIEVDTNGVMAVNLYQNSNNSVSNAKALFFIPEADHYKMSSTGFQGENFLIRGLDQVGAQLFFQLAKAFKPDTQVTPNTLVDGAPTPIAGKSFQATPAQ